MHATNHWRHQPTEYCSFGHAACRNKEYNCIKSVRFHAHSLQFIFLLLRNIDYQLPKQRLMMTCFNCKWGPFAGLVINVGCQQQDQLAIWLSIQAIANLNIWYWVLYIGMCRTWILWVRCWLYNQSGLPNRMTCSCNCCRRLHMTNLGTHGTPYRGEFPSAKP